MPGPGTVLAAENPEDLAAFAAQVLAIAARRNLMLATAESCTGGMLASLLTDIEGVSACFERGFVVYSDEAKSELLGIDPVEITRYGAVSSEIATAMAEGALGRSKADVAVSITGFAGPADTHDEEGLVFLCACSREGREIKRKCQFGPAGRDRIRTLAIRAALEMLDQLSSET